MTTPASDRSGYTVTAHDEGLDSAFYTVLRTADGTGCGAYHSEELVDAAISYDRANPPVEEAAPVDAVKVEEDAPVGDGRQKS